MIYALYPMGSAACTNFNGVSIEGASWQQPTFCSVQLGMVAATQLAAGESKIIPSAYAHVESGPHAEGGDALVQLNTPMSVYAIFGGQRVRSDPTWVSDAGCVVSTGSSGQSAVVMNGWPDVLCVG